MRNFGKEAQDPLEVGLRASRARENQDSDKSPVNPDPPVKAAQEPEKLPEGKVCYPLLPPVTPGYPQ